MDKFDKVEVDIVDKTMELLTTGYEHSLLKELYLLGYNIPMEFSPEWYNIFNINDLARLQFALPRQSKIELLKFINYANTNIVDKLINTNLIKNLNIDQPCLDYLQANLDGHQVHKILIKLGKLNILSIKYIGLSLPIALKWSYNISLVDYVNLLKNRDKLGICMFARSNNISYIQIQELNNIIYSYYYKYLLL